MFLCGLNTGSFVAAKFSVVSPRFSRFSHEDADAGRAEDFQQEVSVIRSDAIVQHDDLEPAHRQP